MIRTHELHRNKNGTYSLRHLACGEVMHSSIGPLEESQALYIGQSELAQRLRRQPITVWDVGLGAATNALGAIRCAIQTGAEALRVVSFENDLSSLAVALENKQVLPYIGEFSREIEEILAKTPAQSAVTVRIREKPEILWEVRAGGFADTAREAARPDLVYYDLYSPKVAPEAWKTSLFSLVRERAGAACELFTYSSATRTRANLLRAGFFVGQGQATGAKNQTTAAATELRLLREPLGKGWLEKIARSTAFSEEERARISEELASHPQFSAP